MCKCHRCLQKPRLGRSLTGLDCELEIEPHLIVVSVYSGLFLKRSVCDSESDVLYFGVQRVSDAVSGVWL